MPFSFQIEHTDGRARAGRIQTDHGAIATPVFMPVGTQAAVKAVTPDMLRGAGAQIILGNTYHLVLRPGTDTIKRAGGLHAFMGWDRPILTDSGGFQVLSLSALREISDAGINFRSHIDGSLYFFSPESAIRDQAAIGADIIMSFDYCTNYPCERAEAERAVALTTKWAREGRDVFGTRFTMDGWERALFGIVQGSTYPDLRERSLEEILALDFPGYAIGALAVGEDRDTTWRITRQVASALPDDRPRYLMGMGTPPELVEGVSLGVDMFDCVMPTRNARNGTVFTRDGRMNLRNAAFANDHRPLDEECACDTCRNFTRAYLRHLFQAGEMLGPTLATQHSLYYYCHLMGEMNEAIRENRFESWRGEFLERYTANDSGSARSA